MKTVHWILAAVTAGSLFLVARATSAQQQADPLAAELRDKLARFQASTQPGEAHARLARLAGEWSLEVRYTMDPSTDPLVIEGTCTNEMVLGGRFLQSTSAYGEGPWAGESLCIFGYDGRYERYTLTNCDTAGTHTITGAGIYDAATRTIQLKGTDHDPILEHTQVYSINLRLVSDDEYAMEFVFYDEQHTKGAESVKLVEIVHRRR